MYHGIKKGEQYQCWFLWKNKDRDGMNTYEIIGG